MRPWPRSIRPVGRPAAPDPVQAIGELAEAVREPGGDAVQISQ